ncbi:MAG: ATP-binding cassette domain-containing protein [Thiovulaceae bacterium]|nr:ATP-binding cassette domain-containing protein [Sulfurimonadaceae bacterium]
MKVKKLHIEYEQKTLVSISFTIKRSLALVGQSGSGKSLTLKALLDMLPSDMSCSLDIESSFKLERGRTLSFVPQNPFTALSPLTRISDHFLCPRKRQEELLNMVGLTSDLLDRYPPELSGGQLQRIVIMIALEFTPKLMLLDEPTTALDFQNRVMIIELLTYLQEELDFKILFVTHDMESARGLCEDIVVIKDGSVVEAGNLFNVMENPQDIYTKELIDSNFAHREFRT